MMAAIRRRTPARYLIVGASCAVLHNLIVIGFDRVGIGYVASSAVSFVVIVLIGYSAHTGFTYRAPRSPATLARYTLAMAANYPITVALLFAMVTLAGLPIYVAAPAGTVILFGWNFLTSRWAIVRHLRPGQEPRPTGAE
jgi:putative flippase GtrA